MSVHLCIICDCFHTIRAEVNCSNRPRVYIRVSQSHIFKDTELSGALGGKDMCRK